MPITRYCWRCDCLIPFLTEDEWRIVHPLLNTSITEAQRLRQEESLALKDALLRIYARSLEKYRELTGFTETNVNALWHHRDALLGKDCVSCGKPYRTPKARYCVACGDGMEKLTGASHPL